ncbi:pre-mRNA cleavage complex 2 protein Pcf11 [Synchiropus splendidus]|uniref:pre-mRNA cleavage complex 2 protein Pcf11 n=1 Tax=Synchiropus splendidus TaxID=270530 RepID=UPI00237DED8F|nr:pre-mRNA cleavage complex 2 protein Pcf11 [Synchiropus splendidus]
MEEGLAREYQSSLEDLTFNSKPHINMLTILAEENRSCARDIAAIIEAQISKAPPTEKLPLLYLVDSIVKNVGGEYLAVFAKNLITSFICVFEKVDENTRKSLFKLRSTWDEVFPLKRLYALDVRVNSLDPAWPIKPLPPTVNASIHVNPKFLKQSEEQASPSASSVPPQTAPVAPALTQTPAAVPQSSLTQEQLFRQQLLAKKKQLLELQQKKIELELEQAKAQLADSFTLPCPALSPTPAPPAVPVKPIPQQAPAIRPWIPPQTFTDTKPTNRDPRLNRGGPVVPPIKEQPVRKDVHASVAAISPEKRTPEKPVRIEKPRTPKKELLEEKSKSPPLMNKNPPNKNKQVERKDPRIKKRPPEKTPDTKEEEVKEKKRCNDRREDNPRSTDPSRQNKQKMLNGTGPKHEDSKDTKDSSSARSHSRKRTRSRSRSPTDSPKRKDRRSPKDRARSSSPSPTHKPGKPRRPRGDEPARGKSGREDRLPPKKNQSENRRPKRPSEDRRSQSRDSPRGHEPGAKDAKELPHRWRSGWEETKHTKGVAEEAHVKSAPQRQRPYGTPNRPTTPRTPKHRLSVDANLQIPEVLNSASKKDLLRRASKRLESGEISQDEFLNMAHKINHFFQYQEEKQLHSDNWESPGNVPVKKPLLATPNAPMNQDELTYYQHKSKLRKTQVNHRLPGEEWEGPDEPGEPEHQDKMGHGRLAPKKYNRPPHERPGERRSLEREDGHPPSGTMVEEYNHGKEFPQLKSLPGLRFRRMAGPRESSEREWNSPLTERQRRDEQKSGYDAPRRFGPSADPRRSEVPPAGTVVHRKCASPSNVDAAMPLFERERLSPLQRDSAEMSPVPRFESPNSNHSEDGPLNVDLPPASHLQGGLLSNVRSDSPGHTPPHDGGHGPRHLGPSRLHPPGWYDGGHGHYEDSAPFERPHRQGPGRFEGGGVPPNHFEGPHMAHGPMRGGDGLGPPHPQGPGRFDAPMNQHPARFDGPGPFEGQMRHFDGSMGPGQMGFQQRPLPFDHPSNQMAPMRMEGPGQHGPRFDGPHFDPQQGQQGPHRFAPQPNLQPAMRPMGPGVFDPIPHQNFNMGPQHFTEPINPQFNTGPLPFQQQQNMQPAGFNMQPQFNQTPSSFYPAGPNAPLQQPMLNMNPSFMPQNQTFSQNPVAPENHFGQVDVNDLLSKLTSYGIIKPPQPDASALLPEPFATQTPAAPVAEEEEEEEQDEDDDLPDLTGFKLDIMKQRYERTVTRLYSGNQCCLCSMRFTAAQTDMYADHLDWHFRQNHAGKVAGKKVTHRRWYYSLTDWIEFEEIADLEERAKSQFFEKENEEEVQKTQAAAMESQVQSVRATKDCVGELCEICQEQFETYWVEEEEDWFLRNAVRVDDKNFHPSCYEDYKNNSSSYIDVSPSPSKIMTEHPLAQAAVKTEPDEVTSCSGPVKQEVEPEACELTDVKKEPELLTEIPSEEKCS